MLTRPLSPPLANPLVDTFNPFANDSRLTGDFNFILGWLDPRITFTRASAGWYFGPTGLLEEAATNIPRFDYNPATLAPLGLLIEEQRTNLFLNSLISGANIATQSITVAASPNTISFYGTGSITLSGASTGTITGLGATTRVTSTFTPSAGSLTCTVSGQVYWAQAELGASASSFIPTEGATVTRAAEVAVMTGTNFSSWFSATQGTFVGEYDYTSAGGRVLATTPQAAGSYLAIGAPNGAQTGWFASGLAVTGASIGAVVKRSLGYTSAGAANSATNGGNYVSSAGSDYTGGATGLVLGGNASGNQINGHVRRLTFYIADLTQTQDQALTL